MSRFHSFMKKKHCFPREITKNSFVQWIPFKSIIVVIVQLLSCVQLFVTPWTAAHKASLSFSISWSLLKSIVLGYSSSSSNDVMVNHLQINYLYLATSSQHTYIPNMQERGKKKEIIISAHVWKEKESDEHGNQGSIPARQTLSILSDWEVREDPWIGFDPDP